jgi:hypothetical protein
VEAIKKRWSFDGKRSFDGKKRGCVLAKTRRGDKKTSVRAGELGSGRKKTIVIRLERENDGHSVGKAVDAKVKNKCETEMENEFESGR